MRCTKTHTVESCISTVLRFTSKARTPVIAHPKNRSITFRVRQLNVVHTPHTISRTEHHQQEIMLGRAFDCNPFAVSHTYKLYFAAGFLLIYLHPFRRLPFSGNDLNRGHHYIMCIFSAKLMCRGRASANFFLHGLIFLADRVLVRCIYFMSAPKCCIISIGCGCSYRATTSDCSEQPVLEKR